MRTKVVGSLLRIFREKASLRVKELENAVIDAGVKARFFQQQSEDLLNRLRHLQVQNEQKTAATNSRILQLESAIRKVGNNAGGKRDCTIIITH